MRDAAQSHLDALAAEIDRLRTPEREVLEQLRADLAAARKDLAEAREEARRRRAALPPCSCPCRTGHHVAPPFTHTVPLRPTWPDPMRVTCQVTTNAGGSASLTIPDADARAR